jgi:hypothetical protein
LLQKLVRHPAGLSIEIGSGLRVRYDAVTDSYEGAWLIVPGRVFEGVLAARVRAGESIEESRANLWEEQHWALDVPGVLPNLRAQLEVEGHSAAPPALRYRAAVVAVDESRAQVLTKALERGGFRAAAYLLTDEDQMLGLRAFLTPAPAVCLLGLPRRLASLGRRIEADTPGCLVLRLATQEARQAKATTSLAYDGSEARARAVVRSVQQSLLRSKQGSEPECDQAAALLWRQLRRAWAETLAAESLAYQGWAKGLVRRSQQARVETYRLRRQASVLRESALAQAEQKRTLLSIA